MARKSRVNIQPPEKHIYKVGAYLRLSRDKNDGKNEDSLENQKNIILSYISDKDDFKLQSTYCDNDKTGTNFNREGFENLMNDIKSKKINCIIVKDLSRFGRDYKDCCNYIENIFPFLGVRFIAINDNFDTNNLTSNDILSMQLKNIVNEMYANDLSKKIKSSLRVKKEEGKYLGAFPPYGYLKDPNDKYKLIVDEEVRPVIEMIFNLRAEGKGYFAIVKELINLNIDSPGQHFYKIGLVKNTKFLNVYWTHQTIRSILFNKVYIGHLIQNKIGNNNFKIVTLPESEWIIHKDIHESIISLELFNKVQEINKLKNIEYNKREKNLEHIDIFKGILMCGQCGKRIYISRTKKISKSKNIPISTTYYCTNNGKKYICNLGGINSKLLEKVVLESIKLQLNICKNAINILKTDTFKKELEIKIDELKNESKDMNFKLDKITKSYDNLYEDYINKFISKEQYIYLKTKYKENEVEIRKEILKISKRLSKLEKKSEDNKFIKNILSVNDIDILNRDIILKLIEKITIYSKDRIEITFKFEEDFNIIKEDLNGGYFYE